MTTVSSSARADPFAPEHDALRAEVRAFVEREIAPHASSWDRDEAFPRALFARAGALGLFGMKYADDVGGSGPDVVADAVVTEELARCGSGGVAASLGAHKDLATLYLDALGTADQRARWLAPSVAGDAVGALAVTEPDAGSDVAAISCRARRAGGDWVLDGVKTFVTNGAWADYVVVLARTGEGRDGLTLFVVDATAPGFEARRVPTLGWRPSQTGELRFDGMRVADSERLGEPGAGFGAVTASFVWERLVMALAQVAGAQRTYEVAKAYAFERHAFGRPFANFQVWRHRFADMATRVEAARALTYAALRRVAAGEHPVAQVAMAKLYSSEVALRVADECVQVHGGYGYVTELPAERILRDARLGPIGGGTSEIMKEIVARGFR